MLTQLVTNITEYILIDFTFFDIYIFNKELARKENFPKCENIFTLFFLYIFSLQFSSPPRLYHKYINNNVSISPDFLCSDLTTVRVGKMGCGGGWYTRQSNKAW